MSRPDPNRPRTVIADDDLKESFPEPTALPVMSESLGVIIDVRPGIGLDGLLGYLRRLQQRTAS